MEGYRMESVAETMRELVEFGELVSDSGYEDGYDDGGEDEN